MPSACIFKDTLRNDTQVLLKLRDSIFESYSHLINSNFISCFLPSPMMSSGAETSKEIPRNNSEVSLPQYRSLPHFHFSDSLARSRHFTSFLSKFNMSSKISIDLVDSDVFFVEQISNEPSLQLNNSPNILNSTELSQNHTAGMPSVTLIASRDLGS